MLFNIIIVYMSLIKIALSWQKISIPQCSYETSSWLELPTKNSTLKQHTTGCFGGLEIFWSCILCLKKCYFFTLSFPPERKYIFVRIVSTTVYQFNSIPFLNVVIYLISVIIIFVYFMTRTEDCRYCTMIWRRTIVDKINKLLCS